MRKFTFQSVFMIAITLATISTLTVLVISLNDFLLDQSTPLYRNTCSHPYHQEMLSQTSKVLTFIFVCLGFLSQIVIILFHIKNLSSKKSSNKIYIIPTMLSFLF